ncbi:MAG: hypothetical protein K8T91_12535 [Planctomycetes bacterium]|nr:hypothetical protein [Planctomycetota bacterium]
MADDFNPYQHWLGLSVSTGLPDHYALLGLEQRDVDQEQVRRSAVQRKARVRGIRPGEQVAAWSRLLDELEAAQRCLSDPAQKAEYDTQLRARDPEPPTVALKAAPVYNPMPPVWPSAAIETSTSPAPQDAALSPTATTQADPQDTAVLNSAVGATPSSTGVMPRIDSASGPEKQFVTAADSRLDANQRGNGLLSGPPDMSGLSHEFVVPRVAPVGPAAQILPPTVTTTPASQGAALLSPVLVQPGITSPTPVPWSSLSPSTAPDLGPASASAIPVFAAPTSPTPKRTSPWTPAALISVAGIGLAIVMLTGAIALVWKNRQDEAAKAGGGQGAKTTGAVIPTSPPEPKPGPTPDPSPPKEPVEKPETAPKPTPAPEPAPVPKPSPMPAPEPPIVPKPQPPIQPKPVPQPKPQPEPTPLVAPTPEQIRQVQAALQKARKMLADRDSVGAMAAVKEAQQLAGEGPLRDTIAPTEVLTQCVREFWSAVGDALPKLTGSEIEVGDTRVFVIASGPDRLLIRWAGKNREFTRKTIPAGLARKIAEDWLEKSPNSKMIVGAFLVVDPTMAANSGREKARKLWTEAAAGGADVGELLKVLSEPAM